VSVQSIHSDERDEKKVLFIFKGRQKCKSIRFQRNTTAQSQLAALLYRIKQKRLAQCYVIFCTGRNEEAEVN
jgi:hypothetical protein